MTKLEQLKQTRNFANRALQELEDMERSLHLCSEDLKARALWPGWHLKQLLDSMEAEMSIERKQNAI